MIRINRLSLVISLIVGRATGLLCPFAHLHKIVAGAKSPQASASTTPSLSRTSISKVLVPLIATEYVSRDGSLLLSPLESWAYTRLEASYSEALEIKCPFFRRRASDLLDGAEMILRFLLVRHKSLMAVPPPMGWRCTSEACLIKNIGITIQEAHQVIMDDWRQTTNKGYYITGRLNTTIYRDDCLFDGPDPDMPVKGLRKYLNAASQLFDQGKSRAQLLSLEIVKSAADDDNQRNPVDNNSVIVAKWRMTGVLRLPWKPKLPNWTGTTTYYFDEDGLIYKHQETWDMSVAQAFLRTLWPSLAARIWSDNDDAAPTLGLRRSKKPSTQRI
jgi:hypothetical protein